MKRLYRVATLSLAVLVLVGCDDSDLQTVAKALRDTAQAVGVLQTTLIDANAQGLIPDDETGKLLLLTIDINTAGQTATVFTRDLTELADNDRENVLIILGPVIDAVARAEREWGTLILDEGARREVLLLLALVRSTLNTAQLALAVRS